MPSTSITLSSGVSYAPYGVLTVTETATSIPNNTSTVSVSLVLKRPYAISSTAPKSASCTINGTTYTWSGTIGGSGDLTLISKTQTVTHDSDGSKTISLSASITMEITWSGQWIGTVSNSGSLALTKLDRYPSCSQSVSSKTETSFTIKWTSDTTISKVEYSTNGGSSYSTATSSANATTGSYTISGLSAYTAYSIRTRVTSKASGLATASTAGTDTTYAYPYANSMPNFNIGNNLTIGVYNPLKRTYSMRIVFANNTEQVVGSYSGTSVSGFKDSSWEPNWYASIPNATSGTYKVKIVYGSNTDTRTGGTYYAVKANALPTAGTLTYADTNSSMTAITGDSTKIVQGKSTVRYTVSGVAGNKSATISSVKVTVNGNTYTLSKSGNNYVGGNAAINSGSNVTATVTVTDSRGYTSTTSKTVTMLAYANPTATIKLTRESNYYTPTTLRVSASASNLNGGNSATIKYRYAQSGGSYGSWTTINNNTNYTLQLDNNYAWNVQVQVTDTAGGTTTYTKVVQRGMPLMYWDTVRTSVGVGMFPANNNSFELGKSTLIMNYDGETNFLMYRSDNNTHGSMYMVSGTDDAMGFAFRFRKPGETSWHYSSRICYAGMLPYNNNAQYLGTSSMQWGYIYGQNIYENGTALSAKYQAKIGSTNIGTTSGNASTGSYATIKSQTLATAGTYLIIAYQDWSTSFDSQTNLRVRLSRGSTSSVAERTVRGNALNGGGMVIAAYWSVSASDVVNVDVYQSSGSTRSARIQLNIIKLEG